MIAADYRNAWAIIRSWKADGARQDLLRAAQDADRLPFITVALIRIAALLAHASEVDRDFTEQLVYADDADAVARILTITDQILSAIDTQQFPGAQGLMNQLDAIPEQLAFRDVVSSDDEVDT